MSSKSKSNSKNKNLTYSKIINDIDIKKMIETEICPYYNKILYGVYIFIIIFQSLIVISLVNIEKNACECANIPEKKFIKEWFIFNIIFNAIILILFIVSDMACFFYITKETIPYIIVSLFSVISFIMSIRLIYYLNILRKNCKCGYGKLEKFLFWYLVIGFSLLFVIILSIILFFIYSYVKVIMNTN